MLAGLVVLAAVLFDPNRYVLGLLRGDAFFQGKPASYWGRALAGDDPKAQVEARAALKDREAVPVLIDLLDDRDAAWRAADILASHGPDAKPAIPALLRAAENKDPHVRSVARMALAEIGSLPPEAVPYMIDMLKTENRLSALKALTELGDESRSAVPALLGLLTDKETRVRASAARALGRIGPEAKDAVQPLIKLLKDEDAVTREQAASALGRIGPASKPAIDDLLASLSDKDYRVRRDATRALGQIGFPEVARPRIEKLLEDPDPRVREAAKVTLEKVKKS